MAVGTQDRRGETRDAARDRQRSRTERGVRSARTATRPGERLPSPPRERRPAMAALAVLLVVGGAAVAALLALRADDREALLVASQDISVGQAITAADVTEVQVAADDLTGVIPAGSVGQLVGTYATVPIAQGRLLDVQMFNQTDAFADGDAAVGVPIPPARIPAGGLVPGDVVQVVQVADGQGTVLVDRARVSALSGSDEEAAVATTDTPVVTLLVDPQDAPAVAGAAAADQLALVLVERAG